MNVAKKAGKSVESEVYCHPIMFRKIISFTLVIAWVALFVDGLLPQIEMAITSGHLPIPTVVLKLIFLFLIVILLTSGRAIRKDIFALTLLFAVIVAATSVIQIIFLSLNLEKVLYHVEASYFFILVLPLVLLADFSVSKKYLENIIIFCGVISASVGIAQHLTGSPILPVVSAGGAYRVWTYEFFGEIRAFGFNGTAADLGQLLTLSLIIILEKYGHCKTALCYITRVFLVSVLVLCIAFTLTRSVYIFSVLAFLTWLVIKGGVRSALLLPLVYFILGIGVIFAAPSIHSLSVGWGSITSVNTLYIRLDEWSHWYRIIAENPIGTLFGRDITQYHVTNFKAMIDNVYLGEILQSGLLSLIFLLAIMVSLWLYVYNGVSRSKSPIGVATLCLLAAYPILFLFELDFVKYMMLFILYVISENSVIENSKTGDGGGLR